MFRKKSGALQFEHTISCGILVEPNDCGETLSDTSRPTIAAFCNSQRSFAASRSIRAAITDWIVAGTANW